MKIFKISLMLLSMILWTSCGDTKRESDTIDDVEDVDLDDYQTEADNVTTGQQNGERFERTQEMTTMYTDLGMTDDQIQRFERSRQNDLQISNTTTTGTTVTSGNATETTGNTTGNTETTGTETGNAGTTETTNANTTDARQQQERMMELRDRNLRDVLTPEQYTRYEQWKKDNPNSVY